MIDVRKISEEEIILRGIREWPVWEKEISGFSYTYEEEEWCYMLEGEVAIENASVVYTLAPGDFVVLTKGLSCTWDIKQPVRKHYNFL